MATLLKDSSVILCVFLIVNKSHAKIKTNHEFTLTSTVNYLK